LEYVDEASGLSTRWKRTLTFQNNSAADLTVTLVWTDYPSTPTAALNLVNDLDLALADPSGGSHYPNGGTTSDRRNNVEVIDLSNPATGEYTINIYGQNVPAGPQPFALVVCGDIANLTDLGTVVIPYSFQPGNWGSTDGACFIATAAYGSPHGRSIDLLRAFRDTYLVLNPIGKKWVNLYYRYSPVLAAFIADHPTMRKGARLILFPCVAFSAGVVHTTALQKGLMCCFIGSFLLGIVVLQKKRIST
jgi:hypothetical protein